MVSASSRIPSIAGLALIAICGSGLAISQVQQVYRYVDPEGRVVYSDKPPPPNARDAQAKRIGRNTIETSNLSYTSALAEERFPVTLYTFGCGTICDTASALLNKRGVPHTVVDVGQGDGADKLKRLTGGLDAPALQVGDQFTTGFNENRWQSMLTDAGYPQTPAPRTAPVGRAPSPPPTPVPNAAVEAPPSTSAKGDYPK
ncbi:MAG TPA: glutaredoxin family protein [Casimicrobiaceae bacterium]|nr:glutaredoxin family protein [Casimicrobiaceae bacterium]